MQDFHLLHVFYRGLVERYQRLVHYNCGGNIIHYTRVMTTTIALETSRGNLSLAMSLGIILIVIALILNSIALIIKNFSIKNSYD